MAVRTTTTTANLRAAPLPRDLRQLLVARGVLPSKVAARSNLPVGLVRDVVAGRVVPTVAQLRAICRAAGVGCAARVVALAVSAARCAGLSGAAARVAEAYAQLPGFDALRAWADRYLSRSTVNILHPVDLDHPLAVHSFSVTYDVEDDDSYYDDKANKWVFQGPLWQRVDELVAAGLLEPCKDRGWHYQVSYRVPGYEVQQLQPDGKGRTRRTKGSPLTFQAGHRATNKDREAGRPTHRRTFRVLVVDAHLAGFPLDLYWRELVGSGQDCLRFTRIDIATPVVNPWHDFALVPVGLRGLDLRERRLFDDVHVARYGAKSNFVGVAYHDPDLGVTRVESRDRYSTKNATRYDPTRFSQYPNPFTRWAQWDLRAAGVYDRRLLFHLLRAQSEGIRALPTRGPAAVLRDLAQVSYVDDDGQWVHPDPNHPANLFDVHFADEVHRLAARLDVPYSYFDRATKQAELRQAALRVQAKRRRRRLTKGQAKVRPTKTETKRCSRNRRKPAKVARG